MFLIQFLQLFFFILTIQYSYSCEERIFSPEYIEFKKRQFQNDLNKLNDFNSNCPNVINNDDNTNICYSYDAETAYNDFNQLNTSPHPLFSALIYKLKSKKENNTSSISYGNTCNTLEILSKEEQICDHKTFNNTFKLSENSKFNIALKDLNSLNHNYIEKNFDESMKQVIIQKWGDFANFISTVNDTKKNLNSSYKNYDNLKTQYALMITLCNKIGAMNDNPLKNKFSTPIHHNYLNLNILDNILNKKNNSKIISPDYFTMDQSEIYYNKKSKFLHGFSLVGQTTINEKCVVIFKDSNPHFNKSSCYSNNIKVNTEYDPKTLSCYILISKDNLFDNVGGNLVRSHCTMQLNANTSSSKIHIDEGKKNNNSNLNISNNNKFLYCGQFKNTQTSYQNLANQCSDIISPKCPEITNGKKDVFPVFCIPKFSGKTVTNGDITCNNKYNPSECQKDQTFKIPPKIYENVEYSYNNYEQNNDNYLFCGNFKSVVNSKENLKFKCSDIITPRCTKINGKNKELFSVFCKPTFSENNVVNGDIPCTTKYKLSQCN